MKTTFVLLSLLISAPAFALDDTLERARHHAVTVHATPALHDAEVSMILTQEANRRAAESKKISPKHLRYGDDVVRLVSRGIDPSVLRYEETPSRKFKKIPPADGKTPQSPSAEKMEKGTPRGHVLTLSK